VFENFSDFVYGPVVDKLRENERAHEDDLDATVDEHLFLLGGEPVGGDGFEHGGGFFDGGAGNHHTVKEEGVFGVREGMRESGALWEMVEDFYGDCG